MDIKLKEGESKDIDVDDTSISIEKDYDGSITVRVTQHGITTKLSNVYVENWYRKES